MRDNGNYCTRLLYSWHTTTPGRGAPNLHSARNRGEEGEKFSFLSFRALGAGFRLALLFLGQKERNRRFCRRIISSLLKRALAKSEGFGETLHFLTLLGCFCFGKRRFRSIFTLELGGPCEFSFCFKPNQGVAQN